MLISRADSNFLILDEICSLSQFIQKKLLKADISYHELQNLSERKSMFFCVSLKIFKLETAANRYSMKLKFGFMVSNL